MKKGYVLVMNDYETNYGVHESGDKISATLFLDKNEAISNLKENIDDSLGWALCDYTKEEIVSAYHNNNGILEGGQEIEEYEETDTKFCIYCNAGNFEFSNRYEIIEVNIDDTTNIKDSKIVVTQIYKDGHSTLDVKIFD